MLFLSLFLVYLNSNLNNNDLEIDIHSSFLLLTLVASPEPRKEAF